MVQTERPRIRQLQKDRLVMLLLPLLLMLMAIQVTFACQCKEVNWERVMCPGENKTVLLGNAISESRATLPGSSEVTVVYTVQAQKVFKEGIFKLTMLPIYNIMMFTPDNCNLAPKDNTTMYIISGDSDAGGILHSSNCTIKLLTGFFEQSGRENLTNIYWGSGSPNCGADS